MPRVQNERRPTHKDAARNASSPAPRITRPAVRAPLTRENQLKTAIGKARIPDRDSRIYIVLLLRRMQWVTGEIPDRFQPRSIAELAELCGKSEATTLRALRALEENGWIIRLRKPVRGRGHKTTYQLDIGRDYPPAATAKAPARTGAERTRRWREKIRQASVTPGPEKTPHETVTEVRQQTVTPGPAEAEKIRQSCVTEYVTPAVTPPGQGHYSAKGGSDVGEVVRDPVFTFRTTPLLSRLRAAGITDTDPGLQQWAAWNQWAMARAS